MIEAKKTRVSIQIVGKVDDYPSETIQLSAGGAPVTAFHGFFFRLNKFYSPWKNITSFVETEFLLVFLIEMHQGTVKFAQEHRPFIRAFCIGQGLKGIEKVGFVFFDFFQLFDRSNGLIAKPGLP